MLSPVQRAEAPGQKRSNHKTIKQQLKTLESYWGFGNMQKQLKKMPANKRLQAAVGNVESYWVSACATIHGSPSGWLYKPNPELIAQIGLHFSLAATFSLVIVNDYNYEPISKAIKLFGECYPRHSAGKT